MLARKKAETRKSNTCSWAWALSSPSRVTESDWVETRQVQHQVKNRKPEIQKHIKLQRARMTVIAAKKKKNPAKQQQGSNILWAGLTGRPAGQCRPQQQRGPTIPGKGEQSRARGQTRAQPRSSDSARGRPKVKPRSWTSRSGSDLQMVTRAVTKGSPQQYGRSEVKPESRVCGSEPGLMGYRARDGLGGNAGALQVAIEGGAKREDALGALARCFFKPKQPEALFWVMH